MTRQRFALIVAILLAFGTATLTLGSSGVRAAFASPLDRFAAAGDAPCHVTQSQYDQLRLNMTVDDVRRIFRCTGELKRSSERFGTRYELYEYAGSREGSGVFADFQNSRLQDKVSVDLD